MARDRKAPRTDTTGAQTDTINYDDAVREGREILAKIEDAERDQLRLGELADKLETIYGDRTLAKYAHDLAIAKCTLGRYRDVYRAWKICAPGRKSSNPSYAVLRELATHPDRAEIIRKDPNITKSEAHDLMRKYKGGAKGKAATDFEKHNKKWFRGLCTIAGNAIRAAEVTHFCKTAEEWCRLLTAIEPLALPRVRKGGEALIALVDHLEALLEEEEQAEPENVEVSAPIERAHPEATAQLAAE